MKRFFIFISASIILLPLLYAQTNLTELMLERNDWGPIGKSMGAFLSFLPDGAFQVIGKYLMGAGYEINGNYLITDGKVVLYPKELQPNFGNFSYDNISWKLDYISKLDNPWFNSYLIQYFEDGEQQRFYNYGDPVAIGTILQYRGVTIERISNVGSVNVNNVYIQGLPQIANNRYMFQFTDPTSSEVPPFSFFLPQDFQVQIHGKTIMEETVGKEANVWYLIEIRVGEYNSYKLETENKKRIEPLFAWIFGEFITLRQ